MKHVTPVLPDKDVQETKFVTDGHMDLPAILDRQVGATSRWLLTPEEIEQVAKQCYIYVRQIGVQNGVQPICLCVDPPIIVEDDAAHDPVLEADEISM